MKYKKPSNYPNISDWEIKNIIDFIDYEKMNGRKTIIESDNDEILQYIEQRLKDKDSYLNIKRTEKITECTACLYRKGCMTEFVCHTSPLEIYKKDVHENIPSYLLNRVFYVENDCMDVWDWSEKVYKFIEELVIYN